MYNHANRWFNTNCFYKINSSRLIKIRLLFIFSRCIVSWSTCHTLQLSWVCSYHSYSLHRRFHAYLSNRLSSNIVRINRPSITCSCSWCSNFRRSRSSPLRYYVPRNYTRRIYLNFLLWMYNHANRWFNTNCFYKINSSRLIKIRLLFIFSRCIVSWSTCHTLQLSWVCSYHSYSLHRRFHAYLSNRLSSNIVRINRPSITCSCSWCSNFRRSRSSPLRYYVPRNYTRRIYFNFLLWMYYYAYRFRSNSNNFSKRYHHHLRSFRLLGIFEFCIVW